MRALVVVNLDEAVEAFLLLQEVERGWPGRFFFQGQMDALVAAVLLWVAGLDAFDVYAEPEPPEG